MNKGFLMFSDEESGLTMLKDEPDDLTHLAPTAGDACIPLEETGPFFNDVFDDFMIPDNYTSLLQDDLSSLDSTDHQLRSSSSISVASPISINDSVTVAMSHQHHSPNSSNSNSSHNSSASSSSASSSASCSSVAATASAVASTSSSSTSSSSASTLSSLSSVSSGIGSAVSAMVSPAGAQNGGQTVVVVGSGASNDPFINYRDEITEMSHSPQHLLSPALSKSPEGSSIPSLCSPNGSGCPEDELAFMTLNMDDDDLDLSMRAPYISMSEVDDLPLLTPDDLMWGAPAASVDSATAAAMEAAAGKYLIKEEYAPPTTHQQQQLSSSASSSSSQGHSNTNATASVTNTTTSSSAGVKASPPITVSTRIAADFNSNTSNNHNNENNCNIGNKIIDSSLAALLCGGNVINIQTSTIQLPQQQQQQQQQQTLNGNRHILVQQQQQQQSPQVIPQTEGDKRIKLIESGLVHPMVVIAPTYKNSNSIETWTMNDLLQLNGTTTGTTTATTGGSKLNVIASIVSKKNSTSVGATGAASHKRPLAESGDGGSKRVKPNPTNNGSQSSQQQSPTSSPQLLQQLMAPSPVPAKAKAKSKSMLDQSDQHRWPAGKVNGLQEQASNSVLMNLLVSGCDVSAGYTCFPRPSKAAKA